MADTLTAAEPAATSSDQPSAAPYELELNRAKRQDRTNSTATLVTPKAANPSSTNIASQYQQITNLARLGAAGGSAEDIAKELAVTAAKQVLKRGIWYYGPPLLLGILATVIGMCVLLMILYGGYCFYHVGLVSSIKIWWNQDINTVISTCSQ